METTTRPVSTTEPSTPLRRRLSADLAIGLGLLGVVVVGKLAWALSDGSFVAALGAR